VGEREDADSEDLADLELDHAQTKFTQT